MSSWAPEEYVSGCWRSYYQYEGPGATQDGHEFIIHATLEPGADRYFSGTRVRICCKDTKEDELAGMAVTDNVGSPSLHVAHKQREQAKIDGAKILLAQQNGCMLAKQLPVDNTDVKGSLPLCTLLFEIVDTSNETWHKVDLVLRSPQYVEDNLRTLYDYIKPWMPSSKSLVLFLAMNHTFRGFLKPTSGLACVYPGHMGIATHGVRILPPSAFRKPFDHLPHEIIYKIFGHAIDEKMYSHWRGTLLSFALVCRAWRPALDHLFRDFDTYNAGRSPPDALGLAKAIETNPDLGKKIRIFSPSHFRRLRENSEATHFAFAKAILIILKNATMMTKLEIYDTHPNLAADFVHALYCSPDVEDFLINRGPLSAAEDYRYILSMADILRCVTHWPRLRKAMIFGFAASSDVENIPVPTCSIEELSLNDGRIQLSQLRLLTASSHSSLREVRLESISGLSNKDLGAWLVEVGPTLTTFALNNTILGRRTDDEEYALDTCIPKMVSLRGLDLEGDVASELVLVRFAPSDLKDSKTFRQWYHLSIDNAPGVNGHGLVSALRSTAFTEIGISGLVLREENIEVKEEAQKIAKARNILLRI